MDILRIIAVLSVILIHCSADFVIDYAMNSPEFFVGNLFCSPAHVGVPVFVMISGALMLDENRPFTIRELYTKSIRNLILLLAFWSAAYCLYFQVFTPLSSGQQLNLSAIFSSLVLGQYHMWYLYMMIGLYLALPILRSFVRRDDPKLVLYFLLFAAITQFTQPLLTKFALTWEPFTILQEVGWKANLQLFSGYTAYFLLGWFLTHVGLTRKLRILTYIAGFFSLGLTVLYVYITRDFGNGYSDLNILVAIYSAALFLAVTQLRLSFSPRAQAVLIQLSKLCFGVYIFHPFLQYWLRIFFPYSGNPVVYIPTLFLLTVLTSFPFCFLCSKIPLLRKAFRS